MWYILSRWSLLKFSFLIVVVRTIIILLLSLLNLLLLFSFSHCSPHSKKEQLLLHFSSQREMIHWFFPIQMHPISSVTCITYSEDNIASFHLQCRPMRGPDIFLYDITSQHTIYMVKIFLIERVGLREDHQRLFCQRLFWIMIKV